MHRNTTAVKYYRLGGVNFVIIILDYRPATGQRSEPEEAGVPDFLPFQKTNGRFLLAGEPEV
jgi:hypothetical protein